MFLDQFSTLVDKIDVIGHYKGQQRSRCSKIWSLIKILLILIYFDLKMLNNVFWGAAPKCRDRYKIESPKVYKQPIVKSIWFLYILARPEKKKKFFPKSH